MGEGGRRGEGRGGRGKKENRRRERGVYAANSRPLSFVIIKFVIRKLGKDAQVSAHKAACEK